MHLPPRQKKLIIVLAFVPFLLAYVAVVLFVSDFVPRQWLVQLMFYIVAGMAWAVPLRPVMGWMNTDSTRGLFDSDGISDPTKPRKHTK